MTVILVHGRGGSADGILDLADELALPDVAFLAPEAPNHTWYPLSFLAPLAQNEPGLSVGLQRLADIVTSLGAQGVVPARIALLGFSQGACLALEFAARHAQRYAGLFGLSGGLIGPPGTPREYAGTFDGTPVFLGCSDTDPHIPLARVHESAAVFARMGATVDTRIYPQMAHTINREEIEVVARALGPQGSQGAGASRGQGG